MSLLQTSKFINRFDDVDMDRLDVITMAQVGRLVGLLLLLGLVLLGYHLA